MAATNQISDEQDNEMKCLKWWSYRNMSQNTQKKATEAPSIMWFEMISRKDRSIKEK